MTLCHDQQATKENLRLRIDSKNEFLTRSNVNQQRVSHSFCRAPRSFRYAVQRVSHSFRRASRSRSTENKQPPCSAKTTTTTKRKELNDSPPPCLPCFCSVSCAQSMTFSSTLKGCGSHIIKCVHSVKLKAMCHVLLFRLHGVWLKHFSICACHLQLTCLNQAWYRKN